MHHLCTIYVCCTLVPEIHVYIYTYMYISVDGLSSYKANMVERKQVFHLSVYSVVSLYSCCCV